MEAAPKERKEEKSGDEKGPEPTTVVKRHLSLPESQYEGDSVTDLRSGRCSARKEHETCFEGPECVAEGF